MVTTGEKGHIYMAVQMPLFFVITVLYSTHQACLGVQSTVNGTSCSYPSRNRSATIGRANNRAVSEKGTERTHRMRKTPAFPASPVELVTIGLFVSRLLETGVGGKLPGLPKLFLSPSARLKSSAGCAVISKIRRPQCHQ